MAELRANYQFNEVETYKKQKEQIQAQAEAIKTERENQSKESNTEQIKEDMASTIENAESMVGAAAGRVDAASRGLSAANAALSSLGSRPAPKEVTDETGKVVSTDDSLGKAWDDKKAQLEAAQAQAQAALDAAQTELGDAKEQVSSLQEEIEATLEATGEEEQKLDDEYQKELASAEEQLQKLDEKIQKAEEESSAVESQNEQNRSSVTVTLDDDEAITQRKDKDGNPIAAFAKDENGEDDKTLAGLLAGTYVGEDGNPIEAKRDDNGKVITNEENNNELNSAAWAFYDNNKDNPEFKAAVAKKYKEKMGTDMPDTIKSEDIPPEVLLGTDLSEIKEEDLNDLNKYKYQSLNTLNYDEKSGAKLSQETNFDAEQELNMSEYSNMETAQAQEELAKDIADTYGIDVTNQVAMKEALQDIILSNPKTFKDSGIDLTQATGDELLQKVLGIATDGDTSNDNIKTTSNVLDLSSAAGTTTTAQQAPDKEHTVESGESMSSIIRKELGLPDGTPVTKDLIQEVAEASGIDNPDMIQPGETITIPGSMLPPTETTTTSTLSDDQIRENVTKALCEQYGGLTAEQLINSPAGKNILAGIMLDHANDEIFQGKNIESEDDIINALVEAAKKGKKVATPDTSVSFLTDKNYDNDKLRDKALESTNSKISYLAVEEDEVNMAKLAESCENGKPTYLDLLDKVQYETNDNGSSVSVKDAIVDAETELNKLQQEMEQKAGTLTAEEAAAYTQQINEAKAKYNSLTELGKSAIQQLAETNPQLFPDLYNENGELDVPHALGEKGLKTEITNPTDENGQELSNDKVTIQLEAIKYVIPQAEETTAPVNENTKSDGGKRKAEEVEGDGPKKETDETTEEQGPKNTQDPNNTTEDSPQGETTQAPNGGGNDTAEDVDEDTAEAGENETAADEADTAEETGAEEAEETGAEEEKAQDETTEEQEIDCDENVPAGGEFAEQKDDTTDSKDQEDDVVCPKPEEGESESADGVDEEVEQRESGEDTTQEEGELDGNNQGNENGIDPDKRENTEENQTQGGGNNASTDNNDPANQTDVTPGGKPAGEGQASTGDGQTSTGEGQTSTGDGQTSTGDGQTSTGDGQTSTGDGQAPADGVSGDGEAVETLPAESEDISKDNEGTTIGNGSGAESTGDAGSTNGNETQGCTGGDNASTDGNDQANQGGTGTEARDAGEDSAQGGDGTSAEDAQASTGSGTTTESTNETVKAEETAKEEDSKDKAEATAVKEEQGGKDSSTAEKSQDKEESVKDADKSGDSGSSDSSSSDSGKGDSGEGESGGDKEAASESGGDEEAASESGEESASESGGESASGSGEESASGSGEESAPEYIEETEVIEDSF